MNEIIEKMKEQLLGLLEDPIRNSEVISRISYSLKAIVETDLFKKNNGGYRNEK